MRTIVVFAALAVLLGCATAPPPQPAKFQQGGGAGVGKLKAVTTTKDGRQNVTVELKPWRAQ